MRFKKLVIVGDGFCGKTSLLYTFKDDFFDEGYEPTVFEQYTADININQTKVSLQLWDTAGQEDYDKLRPLSYPETNVLLICYSVDNPESLQNVLEKWVPEITHFLPGVPFVLVATKQDLREDEAVIEKLLPCKQKPVTFEEGLMVSKKIKANAFIECSSKTRKNVQQVFEAAAKLTIKNKFGPCTIF